MGALALQITTDIIDLKICLRQEISADLVIGNLRKSPKPMIWRIRTPTPTAEIIGSGDLGSKRDLRVKLTRSGPLHARSLAILFDTNYSRQARSCPIFRPLD